MSESDATAGGPFSIVAGCLLGGAIGETLGRQGEGRPPAGAAPVAEGGAGDAAAADAAGAIGWHTQLTVMTAEGLLRGDNRLRARGFGDVAAVVYNAYRRWLAARGAAAAGPSDPFGRPESWLLRLPALADRRGASETLVAALRSGSPGRPGRPINDDNGSDAITRVAPVGLTPPTVDVGRLGMEVAALTHGHVIAQFAAGAVAIVIHRLMAGRALEQALSDALSWLLWAQRERQDGAALAPLVDPLRRVMRAEAGPLAAAVRAGEFGAGDTADQALAIAYACARGARDLEHGVQLAVSHGGARDATGTLAGQFLGAALGAGSVPGRWRDALEAGDALMELSQDWVRHFFGGGARDDEKYPGY
jgi:ADP-ribosylglycohydrolase